MEQTASPKTRRIEVRMSDEERELDVTLVLADQRTIALSEVEATRFLEALERPGEGTVARLKDLRCRA